MVIFHCYVSSPEGNPHFFAMKLAITGKNLQAPAVGIVASTGSSGRHRLRPRRRWRQDRGGPGVDDSKTMGKIWETQHMGVSDVGLIIIPNYSHLIGIIIINSTILECV